MTNPGNDLFGNSLGRQVLDNPRLAQLLGQRDADEGYAPAATLMGRARCKAGMMARMFIMPTWGLLGGSGRLPVAQPSTTGGPAHFETWCLPPSIRSRISSEPSASNRQSVHALELIRNAELFTHELHGRSGAARGRLPAAEHQQAPRSRPGIALIASAKARQHQPPR